ncbi:MAG: glycosyltransferase family 4 protein [Novosphingobium sp.]|nr:glycosyltransferase family 4 protein [Novosphingobium sp.]MBO9601530.1 glycosyltransferase family 4 protein [Novosphingobium sp.]
MRPLKIAQIAPLAESVPPKLYGGTERVVSWLTEELVRQGHDVTVFASGDSVTSAKLVSVTEQALRLNPLVRDTLGYHVMLLEEVRRRAHEFDVIHFHIDLIQAPFERTLGIPSLTTLHGRLDLPDLVPFYRAFPDLPLVSISNNQRLPMPPVNWLGTVLHGLPASLLPGTVDPQGGYLAFLGRISPEKRPDRAIEIAAQTGIPLKIAAKIDNADRDYWNETIAPLVAKHGDVVEFVGEINDQQKAQFLGNAKALLFPIDWPEPFGLVMIEAMACATPVIAFRCGSVPEVIDHGVTGFIVDDIAGAVAAVGQLDRLPREGVRARFEARFTAERMARDYVALYEYLVDANLHRTDNVVLLHEPERPLTPRIA